MCPQKTALYAVLGTLFVFSSILEVVHSSGLFELQIRSFRNDQGLTSNGTCCKGIRRNGNCSETCQTYFKVCLSHYQANIATNPKPKCTFANFTTTVLGHNNLEFFRMLDLPSETSQPNNFYFPVKDFSWPGDFSLIIEAWHDSGSDNSIPDLLISRLAVIRSVSSGEEWFKDVFNYNYKELHYAFRFTCDEHYYGANCADMCRPRDDRFGHFSCSGNGTRVCLDGWIGDYCARPICLPGCDIKHGYCDAPYECKCDPGWQGKYCNQCIPLEGCRMGTCTEPWQCNCMEGWGGGFCNQDLNFCTHHKPCVNGGICQNTGEGSYTCTCIGSYTGVNCEREIDDCKNEPCKNDGTCEDIGNGFQCRCPKGFYGRHCENVADSCKTNPCMFAGTCVDQEDSYYCICKPGYTGYNCEVDINDCAPNPCLNGRCVDQLNGYRCVCDTGFSGAECQINDNDCYHNPCQNDGQCVDKVNDFMCRCKPGFVGTLCQDDINECEMRPCANGGHCKDLENDFHCTCAPGFEGKDCSLPINECRPDPCKNNGICTDLLADYSCLCPEGFWGKNCQNYEGYTEPTDPALTRDFTTPSPIHTTPNNTDKGGQMSPHTKPEEGEEQEDVGLTMAQLLIIVCLGVGIPLILIIIAVIFLLCRKRSCMYRQRPSRSMQNMAKEKEQNYINNMNNKSSGDIFTTPLPSSASNSSSIKISNEEQQDINKLKAKQMLIASGGNGSSLTGGGVGEDGGTSVGRMQTSSSKQFLRDVAAVHTHYELPQPQPSSVSASISFPPSSSSSTSSSKGGRRGSDCDYDYDFEKPYRKLEVDSLQVDTRRPVSVHSEFQPRHSREAQIEVKSPDYDLEHCDSGANKHARKDNIHNSVLQSYNNTSPSEEALRSISTLQHQQQQQQQQLQQPQEHFKPPRAVAIYDTEDYWATEV